MTTTGAVLSNFPARGQGKVFLANDIEVATAQLWVHSGAGIKSFIATGAPIGQSLRYDSSSDAAIARAVSEGAGAKSSVKVGDEATLDAAAYAELKSQLPDVSAGVRYAVLDAGGHVTEEVVVAKSPEGWRAARYDSCK